MQAKINEIRAWEKKRKKTAGWCCDRQLKSGVWQRRARWGILATKRPGYMEGVVARRGERTGTRTDNGEFVLEILDLKILMSAWDETAENGISEDFFFFLR